MNKWQWIDKLRDAHGGKWLGTAREYLQSHALNGNRVIWGSQEEVRGLTVRDIEEMAMHIAGTALAEYKFNIIKEKE